MESGEPKRTLCSKLGLNFFEGPCGGGGIIRVGKQGQKSGEGQRRDYFASNNYEISRTETKRMVRAGLSYLGLGQRGNSKDKTEGKTTRVYKQLLLDGKQGR